MDLRIDDEKGIAYIKFSGAIDKEAILAAFDAAVSDPSYKPGMARLWDFRDADLSSLDAAVIAEMAEYPTRFPEGICDVKVAFVVGRQLEYGLTRMFQAFSHDAQTTTSTFYSIEEAEAWLAE